MDELSGKGVTALLARLVQGVGKLIADHVALARLEIGEDAKTIGARLVTIALFLPLVLTGYALLMGALAVFLGQWLTLSGALLVVGGANFAAGGIGLKVAAARLRITTKVDELVGEAQASVRSTLTAIDRRLLDGAGGGR